MKLLARILTVALALVHLSLQQGFTSNCSWAGSILNGSFLGMYCNDNDWATYSYMWTWFDLNHCLRNNGGTLIAYDNGSFYPTCSHCVLIRGKVTFQLVCECNSDQGALVNTVIDLNALVWNHDGFLGCFNHKGVQSRCGPMCTDPNFNSTAWNHREYFHGNYAETH